MVARSLAGLLVGVTVFAVGAALPGIVLGQACTTAADIDAAVALIHPARIEHEFMGADVVAWIEASPSIPPSLRDADHVMVITNPEQPSAFVWLLRDGCVIGSGLVGLARLNALVDIVLGTGEGEGS